MNHRADRWSGIVLIAAPLLSVFAMSHHPTVGPGGPAERMAEIVHEAPLTTAVHGGLMALMVAILLALAAAAARLGWSHARVRSGAVLYSLGVLCMVGAATVSGFVVPDLAAGLVDAPATTLEAATPAFALAHAVNQALARIGAVAMSAGIALASLVMLGRSRLERGLGGFGLLVGLVPILGLLAGSLQLDVHGMLLVLAGQSLWTLGVGIWLLAAPRTA